MGQLGVEGLGVLVGREVAARLAPAADRVGDPADELAHAGLALGRAEVAAEVLADDHVGGRLAPELGHLDALLLEDRLAALVGDDRVADLPLDRVERMHPGLGVAPPEADPGRRPLLLAGHRLRGLFLAGGGSGRHLASSCLGYRRFRSAGPRTSGQNLSRRRPAASAGRSAPTRATGRYHLGITHHPVRWPT